jgi:hypothetical protein
MRESTSPETGARREIASKPERPRFDLSTIMGIKVEDIQVPEKITRMADQYFEQLEHDGANQAQLAELAYAFRRQLQTDLRQVKDTSQPKDETHEAAKKGSITKRLRIKLLKTDETHAFSLEVYRRLLEQSSATLQTELARHQQERREINGNYETYKTWKRELHDTRINYHTLLSQMFKRAGQESKPFHLAKRATLEASMADLEAKLDALKQQKPELASLIEYDILTEYARQLRDEGFVWTPSRLKLLDDMLKASLTNRPVVVLMGETGTGKTAMVRAASQRLSSREPERTVGGNQEKFARLLASPAISDGKTYYAYGPILRAMTGKSSSIDANPAKEGHSFFDDEFNTRPTSVQREIQKFLSEARVGRTVSIPGTPMNETVMPGFIVFLAGNPPSERYDREETGIETKREFAGNVLNVEYLEQTPDNPELFQVLEATLMDQPTGRFTAVSAKEVAPSWQKDAATGTYALEEDPRAGAFLYRFANAWSQLYKAFSHQDTVLTRKHPGDTTGKWHLPSFILDPGVVISWLDQYKASPRARKEHLAEFMKDRLAKYLSQFPDEEQKTVEAYLAHFGIALSEPTGRANEIRRLKKIYQSETVKPELEVLTPKQIGFLNPNVPRPREQAAPLKFDAVDLLDAQGETVGHYVKESVLGVEPGGVILKRERVTQEGIPQCATLVGLAFDEQTKQADQDKVIVRDPDGNPHTYSLREFRAYFEPERIPTPSSPEGAPELTPFQYDAAKAREYGFAPLEIEPHQKAQELVDALYARDARFVTIHNPGDPDPDDASKTLIEQKIKLNEQALKDYWEMHCSDLPNTPVRSKWYFEALAQHMLSQTIDGDDPNNLNNPITPHIPTFGQKSFMLAMDFPEFDSNNSIEKQTALSSQTKQILNALFGKEDPTSITRDEINEALWSDHDARVQSDTAKAVIQELLGPSANPDEYELRLMRPDEYQRAAQTNNYGQKSLWTHMDGYYTINDGLWRRGLIAGGRLCGGASAVATGTRNSSLGDFAVRLVLSRKSPEVKPGTEAESFPIQEARDILGPDNVLGPEAVKATWERDLTAQEIPPIPYSREQLEAGKRMNMMLVLRMDRDKEGKPLTGKHMNEIIQPKLQAAGKGKLLHNVDWYAQEPFYETSTPTLAWKLVTRDLIEGSKGLNYTDQTKLLRDTLAAQPDLTRAERDAIQEANDATLARLKAAASSDDEAIWKPAAQELAALMINQNHRRSFADVLFDYAMLLQSQDKRLFDGKSVYDWTSDLSSGGALVHAGLPDSGGLGVSSLGPRNRSDFLGVSLSR